MLLACCFVIACNMLYLANFMISKLKYFVQNKYLSSVSNNGIRTPFIDVIKSLLQTLASICPFITKKGKILMELLFYSGIVSITDWKYTKSVGIKNQVFWTGVKSHFVITLALCNT